MIDWEETFSVWAILSIFGIFVLIGGIYNGVEISLKVLGFMAVISIIVVAHMKISENIRDM